MPYKDPNCSAAKEARHKAYKKWYENRSDEYRLKRNAVQRDYHNKNREERNRQCNERNKKLHQKYCIEVLTHYGGNPPKCACCGENHILFLTIDHINGDGAEHKRRIKQNSVYRWLIKNNFPEGYQVLCYNCNCGKYRTHSNSQFCPVHHP